MHRQATGGILRFFNDLPDPRAHNVIHKLHDILVIAVCAVICGADGWAAVELFGQSKISWFSTFLDLPCGIPSHDTFGRVFAHLEPQAYERRFCAWTASLSASVTGVRLIAIDGKSIRRSFQHAWDHSGMAHLVSAFVQANSIVFGQIAVAEKSNEIDAIPRLLALLDLTGATVTIDAMGCQREIAREIVQREGDYVLPVKQNQPALHRKVKTLLDEAILEPVAGMNRFEQTDGDHGRIETRVAWVTDQVHWLGEELLGAWPGLATVGAVECKRQTLADGKTSIERRYFISSIKTPDAARLAEVVRGHWSVENNLHWQLDVSFGEDQRRIRKDHGAENFSRLCRLALNLLKRDSSVKAGIRSKRLKAGWDEHYLLRVLTT